MTEATVPDPTQNVLDLVNAAIERQDDLRTLEAANLRELLNTHSMYRDKLEKAETARIDAIRAVDVGAVQRAAEVSAAQADTLAKQVATSAETLRAQVATAAVATRAELQTTIAPMQEAIARLSQAQYEAQGQKLQVVETRDKGGSVGLWVGIAIGVITFIVSMISIAVALYISTGR